MGKHVEKVKLELLGIKIFPMIHVGKDFGFVDSTLAKHQIFNRSQNVFFCECTGGDSPLLFPIKLSSSNVTLSGGYQRV